MQPLALLFLLFVTVPVVELLLLLRVGAVIGPVGTIVLVVVTGALGAALARQQGKQTLTDWREALAEGRVPQEGLTGSLLVLLGGVLLITPGILTDLVGLALLVPATRRVIGSQVQRWLQRQVETGRVRMYGRAPTAPRDPQEPFHARRKDPRGAAARRGHDVPGAPGNPGKRGQVIDTQGEEVDD